MKSFSDDQTICLMIFNKSSDMLQNHLQCLMGRWLFVNTVISFWFKNLQAFINSLQNQKYPSTYYWYCMAKVVSEELTGWNIWQNHNVEISAKCEGSEYSNPKPWDFKISYFSYALKDGWPQTMPPADTISTPSDLSWMLYFMSEWVSKLLWPLLLTWFNLNPSMDK